MNLTKPLAHFGDEGQPPVSSTTDKGQLIGAQLFSRVPSGLSQGKFLDL